jgi:Domain of unknown function (DUF4402)
MIRRFSRWPFLILAIWLGNMTPVIAQTTSRPLLIEQRSDLIYPKIAATANAAGTLTIDANSGAVTKTGSIVLASSNSARGELYITGEPGYLVSVRLPNNLTLSAATGGQLKIQQISHNGPATLRLDSFGTATLKIGATLRITGNAQAGEYRGRMVASIDYVFE